jgi:hypothetical protein
MLFRPLPLLLCLALLLAGCGAGGAPVAPTDTPAAPAATDAPAATMPTVGATEAPAATAEATSVGAAPEKCASVERVSALTPEGDALVQGLVAAMHAPPTESGAMGVRQIDRLGDWAIVEATPPNAEPGIFVLKKEGAAYTAAATWGGVAQSAQEIRDYLAQNTPGAPAELFACFEPAGAPFAPAADAAACSGIARIDPASDAARAVAAAVSATNTTFGAVAEIRGLDQLDGWSLLEAVFAESEPGIFLLHDEGGAQRIAAVWGGIAESRLEIRRYLAEQAPGAPAALLTCFEPKGSPFVEAP